jgi:hypothetical protein
MLVCLLSTVEMIHIRIINASLDPIHEYETLERELCSCNANIYFDRQCFQSHSK